MIQFVLEGTPLAWAPRVRISVNGRLVRTLRAPQAADPRAWGSDLDGLRRIAKQVHDDDGHSFLPMVRGGFHGDDGAQRLCGVAWPSNGVYSSLYASVGLPGESTCERQQIAVSSYEGAAGAGFNQVQTYDPTRLN